MNSQYKMVLLSEREFQRRCKKQPEENIEYESILSSNLPNQMKINLINDLIHASSKRNVPKIEQKSTINETDDEINDDTNENTNSEYLTVEDTDVEPLRSSTPIPQDSTNLTDFLEKEIDFTPFGAINTSTGEQIKGSNINIIKSYLKKKVSKGRGPPGIKKVVKTIARRRTTPKEILNRKVKKQVKHFRATTNPVLKWESLKEF
jgi:hypothetical protein